MFRGTVLKAFYFAGIISILTNCSPKPASEDTLFSLQSSELTNIDFVNQLDFKGKFNIYTYRNFYNGGGVGLADINNDSLLDIYFISNMEKNKLFLNKGNFEFEDITER